MKEVSEREFNEYAAKIMGYEVRKVYAKGDLACYKGAGSYFEFDPYNDLNQMAGVVEKLLNRDYTDMQFIIPRKFGVAWQIKKSLREFIISTMPEKENEQRQ